MDINLEKLIDSFNDQLRDDEKAEAKKALEFMMRHDVSFGVGHEDIADFINCNIRNIMFLHRSGIRNISLDNELARMFIWIERQHIKDFIIIMGTDKRNPLSLQQMDTISECVKRLDHSQKIDAKFSFYQYKAAEDEEHGKDTFDIVILASVNNGEMGKTLYQIERQMMYLNSRFEFSREQHSKMEDLRRERWEKLLDNFEFNDENAQLLIAFNDRLRDAISKSHGKFLQLKDEINEKYGEKSKYIDLSMQLFLDYDYPHLNPNQSEHCKQIWEVLTTTSLLYEDGFANININVKKDGIETLEDLSGNEITENWNEMLPEHWSKDMHLIEPFHHLFAHCRFALQDLIYVDKINVQFKVDIDMPTNEL